MSQISELRELTRVRVLAFSRQGEAVFWVFAFPLLLAAILGFAFRSSEAPASRIGLVGTSALGENLRGAKGVEVERFETLEDAERALRVGKIDALLSDAEAEPPIVRLDESRQEAELARLRIAAVHRGGDEDEVAVDPVTERGSRYIDFLFPGLLGMNLMGTGLWMIGFAVADMRQKGFLKRLLVTPMRRSSFLLSFLLSRLLFLAMEVGVLVAFALWVLDVPFRTNGVLFSFVTLLGAVSFSSLGILAASRARTIEAVSGLLNFVMVPMWLGSGVFFSYERFPEVFHPVLRLLPLTALNDALRALMLEGAGVAQILPELGVLLFWTVVPFAVALRVFRWV